MKIQFEIIIDDRICLFLKKLFNLKIGIFFIAAFIFSAGLFIFSEQITRPPAFEEGTIISSDAVNSTFDLVYEKVNTLDTRVGLLEVVTPDEGPWTGDVDNIYYMGNVGIGITSPEAALDIRNNSRGILMSGGTGGGGDESFKIQAIRATSSSVYNSLALNPSGGNVGIGTTNPSYRLQIGETSNYGYVDTTGAWQSSSDIRQKENICEISNGLNKILALRGVSYNTIGSDCENEHQIGFIAQELEEIIPEIVSTDSAGYKGIAYAKVSPLLVEAVKELKAENDLLKQELAEIKELLLRK